MVGVQRIAAAADALALFVHGCRYEASVAQLEASVAQLAAALQAKEGDAQRLAQAEQRAVQRAEAAEGEARALAGEREALLRRQEGEVQVSKWVSRVWLVLSCLVGDGPIVRIEFIAALWPHTHTHTGAPGSARGGAARGDGGVGSGAGGDGGALRQAAGGGAVRKFCVLGDMYVCDCVVAVVVGDVRLRVLYICT